MDSLMKYVPFVDFLLKTNAEKYYKFTKIKKWIQSKKPYSSNVVKKTEEAVLTQYKNLLLENKVKIPQNITATFTPSIDLCSDDEEQDSQSNRASNSVEDDDLEFISIDYGAKAKEENEKQSKKTNSVRKEYDIDEASKDILNKIDQLAADEMKLNGLVHRPVNYTFEMKCDLSDPADNGQEVIFQRREPNADKLFERHTDFTVDDVVVECLNDKKKFLVTSEKPTEVINLDSDSECELCNEGEPPSTSNVQILHKENTETNLARPESEILNTDSNSIGSSKNDDKLEFLCNSIESVLPEMSDILNEVEEVDNGMTSQGIEKATVVEENEKEENMEKNTTRTINLDPEQISKIMEDISSKTDFELETFYEALQYVRQMDSQQKRIPETPPIVPPPAPPPIPARASIAVPVLSCYEQQRLQMVPPSTVCNASNDNFVPTLPPPRPKLNINDPRIRKQLQIIKNSPLFSYNLLNNDLEENIKKICHETVMQTSSLNLNKKSIGHRSASETSATSTNKSTITYGEYKRRQLKKKIEIERKREEELQAKIKSQLEREQREKLVQNKNEDLQDIRSQLISTLDPCKEALYSLWKQQNGSKEKQQKESQQNNKVSGKELKSNSKGSNPEKTQKENIQTKPVDNAKELNSITKSKVNNKQSKSKTSSENKLNRIYSELNCTVKGFDQLQHYIAKEPDNTSNGMQDITNSPPTIEQAYSTKLTGLRRRSSIHALSAITAQLGFQSDCSDSELSKNKSKNDSSSEDVSQDSFHVLPKRRKTVDEIIRPSKRTKVLRLANDETSSSDNESETHKNLKHRFSTKVPIIKLHRMSNEFIKKHAKRARKDSENADQSVRLKKTSETVENLQEPSQKKLKLKKYNNDCQMTERNTVFCVLCRSKPLDLTNHYKGRHKIESYISRLDWSDLEDLAVNTRFATLQPNTKNYGFERYEVECPFCKEKIIDQFINLYNHYSAHTGEYAFQCSHCLFSKPYKPDIQSHLLHSKTCRKSKIQIIYRYPPQAQCIYLHYCSICNFVQLNEANVLKHLREHHDPSKAVQSYVQKCILAAISNAPDGCQATNSISPMPTVDANNTTDLNVDVGPSLNQADTPTKSEIKFKVDDDDIPVSNEPCVEEDFLDNESNKCEEMLNHRQKEVAQPMTVIHNVGTDGDQNSTKIIISQLSTQRNAMRHHQPINIKAETVENNQEENTKLTSSACSQQKQPLDRNLNTVYEKYRSYPPNANYMGLFKCMIDDCFYSTDCVSDIITHLTEHSVDEQNPNQYLQCPYCIFTSDTTITPTRLVDHVQTQHGHLKFQCSLCCYRSCDASNVHFHQQTHHNAVFNTCKIYKTSIDDSNLNRKGNSNLNEKIEKNVFKISCKLCGSASFYHTQLLINHMNNDHKLSSATNSLKIYSCINCPFTVDNKKQLRFHVANKHPGERPLIFDHNQTNNINEDSKGCSNVVDISEPVTYIESKVNGTLDVNAEESMSLDVKPDLKELLLMNEETVKVRLRKLTSHTGVAPDNLYRCPEQACGGFFSNAELWLRHMKVRHLTLECQCPHCPTPTLLPLEELPTHFEQHRRHTYICFYCPTTSPTESLARKHAAQKHREFRTLRFEKICFNINYAYWILIQKELFQERDKFIAEFLTVLDERLNELERNEMKNLIQQWPIRDNTPWFDDYLQNLRKRKVARRCLVKDCNFRTLKEEILYRHLSTSHTIAGTQFNCSKCNYHVERCNNLDELFNHIKLHNEYHFICSACSLITSSRSKITAHIEEQHTARDVPVIHLFRGSDQMYHKIYIVFADDNITFSTMKNCFCCSEKNMSGDVFNLHLKRFHNLSLHYYCEKCTNFSFASLKEVKPHFEQFHSSGKLKLRCELAGRSGLHVLSLNNFQVEILKPTRSGSEQTLSSVTVKIEPLDVSDSDNVVFIEDDDVVIEKTLKEAQQKEANLPKLKCVSFSKLLKPNLNSAPTSIQTSSQVQQTEMPRLTCAAYNKLIEPNTTMSTALQTHAVGPPMPVPSTFLVPLNTSTQGYYNLDQRNINTNPLMNSMNVLNPPAQNNNCFMGFNNCSLARVGSLPLNISNQNSLSNLHNNLPNNQYRVDQTSNNSYTVQPNNIPISNSTTSPLLIRPQNYEYNTSTFVIESSRNLN